MACCSAKLAFKAKQNTATWIVASLLVNFNQRRAGEWLVDGVARPDLREKLTGMIG